MKIIQDFIDFVAFDDDGQRILAVGTRELDTPVGGYEEKTVCIIEAIYDYGRDIELEQQALKAICEKIKEIYGEWPYLDNQFSTFDDNEKRLIAFMIENGFLPKQQLVDQEFGFAEPALEKKPVRQNLINATTAARVTGSTYGGYVPEDSTVVKRHARSFASDRLAQLLRQISTQIYLASRLSGTDPVEVEVMFVQDALYIATNTQDSMRMLKSFVNNKDRFKLVLTMAFTSDKFTAVDKETSARHSKKLKQRLYGNTAVTDPRIIALRNLFTQDSALHTITLPVASSASRDMKIPPRYYYKGAGIYFVEYPFKTDRHAEEHLLDVLERIVQVDLEPMDIQPAIFGKKRPCFTCHARLKSVSEQVASELSLTTPWLEYNPYMGFLYRNAAYSQNLMAAAATAKALANAKEVHVSAVGDSSYATGSDTETEDAAIEEVRATLDRTKLSVRG